MVDDRPARCFGSGLASAQNPISPPGVDVADPTARVWASGRVYSERACLLYGHVRIEGLGRTNEQLAGVRSGDAAAYNCVDFSDGVTRVTVRVAPSATPARIRLALDSLWGPTVGTIDVPGGGDGATGTTARRGQRSPRT
jgi:hypothetical protein